MAVIFSALGIILLLSTVIVNALDVHEENQELLKLGNENPRLNLFEMCECIQEDKCFLYCSAGNSTDISKVVSHHWEKNPHCHSNGITLEISSTIHFPKFKINDDWLNGNFKLKELHVDLENVFEICENAFAGTVFEWMNKLVLINFHLRSMDFMVLQKLFVQYERLTITKNPSNQETANAVIELNFVSTFYLESDTTSNVENQKNVYDPTDSGNGNTNRALIATVTFVACILCFSLGLLIRCNGFDQKKILNQMTKANRVIFVVEDTSRGLRQSAVMQHEKRADKILSANP